MDRRLESLHLDGFIGSALADLLRRGTAAFGEQIAKPLPVSDLLDKFDNDIGVAPVEFQAVGVSVFEYTRLIAIDRASNRGTA
jgi:hypothetical protein